MSPHPFLHRLSAHLVLATAATVRAGVRVARAMRHLDPAPSRQAAPPAARSTYPRQDVTL